MRSPSTIWRPCSRVASGSSVIISKPSNGTARGDQNLSDAEEVVGYFYQCGFGVKRDYAQALAWYRRATSHGNSNAENQLGRLHGGEWMGPTAELRRGFLLVLQSSGTWQRPRHGKHRL